MLIELWGGGRHSAAPCGVFAQVDDADGAAVAAHRWYALRPRRGGRVYAATKIRGATALMHRLLLGAVRGEEVDHANRDGLDNRRSNLRRCTTSQNHANLGKPRGYLGAVPYSRFKGVHRADSRRNPFAARLGIHGGARHLGVFPTEEAAARAYDAAAREHFGEFARTNFATAG